MIEAVLLNREVTELANANTESPTTVAMTPSRSAYSAADAPSCDLKYLDKIWVSPFEPMR